MSKCVSEWVSERSCPSCWILSPLRHAGVETCNIKMKFKWNSLPPLFIFKMLGLISCVFKAFVQLFLFKMTPLNQHPPTVKPGPQKLGQERHICLDKYVCLEKYEKHPYIRFKYLCINIYKERHLLIRRIHCKCPPNSLLPRKFWF